MNVKKRWVAYCSGNTRDATEDDWNNFVLKIFLNWQQQQLELDSITPKKAGKAQAEFADTHYSFTHFIQSAETYQELVALEPMRRAS